MTLQTLVLIPVMVVAGAFVYVELRQLNAWRRALTEYRSREWPDALEPETFAGDVERAYAQD